MIQAYLRKDSSSIPIPDEEAMSIGANFAVHLIWCGYNRTFFTHDFMEGQLYKAGFTRVDRCGYKETRSPHTGIVELDNRKEESLFVEAIKLRRPCLLHPSSSQREGRAPQSCAASQGT